MRILKKYANRRLYDTETSSYITLEDVQKLVVQFKSVQVIDIATGKDITEQILLAVISNIESQKTHQKILTRTLLEQLIRMYSYDYSASSPLSTFLENALRFYGNNFEKAPPGFALWQDMAEKQYEFWQNAFGLPVTNPVQKDDDAFESGKSTPDEAQTNRRNSDERDRQND